MEMPILTEVVIIFGLTIAVLIICNRFKIPTVVGFLISGMLAGPSGMKFITNESNDIQTLSEIGVVMLLFTIGIEFSLTDLVRIRKSVLLGGSLQVFLTLAATAAFSKLLGLSLNESIFMGFLISLSSTAIVLKILQQRDEINSPHGKFSLAILIFQDIIVVPMMLVTPILSGKEANLTKALLMLLLKGAGIIVLTLVSAQWIMPRVLFQIVRMRSQEIFLISIIVICFAVAWFTYSLGLSLSLGAFLAGLIISESEYSHQALSIVLPFRDVFTSFFFISIGMLLDIHFMLAHPLPILLITLGVLVMKGLLSGVSAFLMGLSLRTVVLSALALLQVGEFSFVLSKVGLQSGLLSTPNYQIFLAVSILTMAASPFIIPWSYRLSDLAMALKLPDWLVHGWQSARQENEAGNLPELEDHLIIIGFGVSGKNVARAASSVNIPYAAMEMNADTVKKERRKGENIFYGDATQENNLAHLHIRKAKVLVVAIPDPVATRGIVALAHRLNPAVFIIVRTHYMKEMKPLFKLGANEVIPEEFETSIEIFSIVLTKYLVPQNDIDAFISSIRADRYRMLRSPVKHSISVGDLQRNLSGIDISAFAVHEQSGLTGRTLSDIGLRANYGVNLLAIIRDETVLSNPDADTMLLVNDRIIVSGNPDEIFVFSEIIFGKADRRDSV
jgi:CPA2 family monovalent cation:H+ antiporter-2